MHFCGFRSPSKEDPNFEFVLAPSLHSANTYSVATHLMKPSRLIILTLAVLLTGCTSYKQMFSDAQKYEQGGMKEEALELYSHIYTQDDGQIDAHIALNRIGGEIMNRYLADMRMSITMGNFDNAMDTYHEAVSFASEYRGTGIEFSDQFDVNYNAARAGKADQLYNRAEVLVMEGRYEDAQDVLDEVFRYDRNHEKAEYLELLSELYPSYNRGVKAMDLGLYKEAHNHFEQVTCRDIEFKDAWQLQQECVNRGSYTISYVPIHHSGIEKSMEVAVGAGIQQQVLGLKDPFIKLLDRNNLSTLIEEQINSMSAHFDESAAIEAGKFKGAQYVLTGELVQYSNVLGPVNYEHRKGYLGDNVEAKKVRYVQYARGRKLEAHFKYQLLNAETGEVYISQTVPFEGEDWAQFIDFEGNPENLYAGEWKYTLLGSKLDEVYNAPEEKEKIDQLATGSREPISKVEFDNRLVLFIGDLVAQQISDFEPPQ